MKSASSVVVVAHPILFYSHVVDTSSKVVVKLMRSTENLEQFTEIVNSINKDIEDKKCCHELTEFVCGNVRIESAAGWMCEVYLDGKRVRHLYIDGSFE